MNKNMSMISYHFIGIGGIGMSGLARILLGEGHTVSGSDMKEGTIIDSLRSIGATIYCGHQADQVPSGAVVVYSTAIRDDNPEYQYAAESGMEMLHRSDLLFQLAEGKKVLAVTGTHGKTTTSSLLSHVMISAGRKPTCVVGGILRNYSVNSVHGTGPEFVVEADESDGTFVKYHPNSAIITTIGKGDHLAHYGSQDNLEQGFRTFIDSVSSVDNIIYYGDDKRLATMMTGAISYGFLEDCDVRIENFRQETTSVVFDLIQHGTRSQEVVVPMFGVHNALNATAVWAFASHLGVHQDDIRTAFRTFEGIERRCTARLEYNGALIIDDYAHHPTEIAATLRALKEVYHDRRIIALFQPHRYSRMNECISFLGDAFADADEVVLTDIYTAGEQPLPGISVDTISQKIEGSCTSVTYLPRANVAEKISQEYLNPSDVVVTLGAGDITAIAGEVKTYVGA